MLNLKFAYSTRNDTKTIKLQIYHKDLIFKYRLHNGGVFVTRKKRTLQSFALTFTIQINVVSENC